MGVAKLGDDKEWRKRCCSADIVAKRHSPVVTRHGLSCRCTIPAQFSYLLRSIASCWITFVTDVYHGPSYRVAPPSTLRQLLPLNGVALTLTPQGSQARHSFRFSGCQYMLPWCWPVVEPISPTIRRQPFNDSVWLFEPKYDGFRDMVYLSRKSSSTPRGGTSFPVRRATAGHLCRVAACRSHPRRRDRCDRR